jgi:hypothetical protein
MNLTCRSLLLCCATLLGTMLAVPARGANLLTNGSFEIWTGGQLVGNEPDRIFNDGSLVVAGWNFAIGLSSDIYRDLNAPGALSAYYDAADGNYLAGAGSFGTLHEGISQTFLVSPNTQYQVTFQMAPGGLNYSGSWIENASVGSSWMVDITGAVPSPINNSYNNNLANFNASGTTNPLVWTPQSLIFTSDAVGGSVTLQFTAYGDMTHDFLDNVTVIPVEVPEPSTLVLAGLGFVTGMGIWSRRK